MTQQVSSTAASSVALNLGMQLLVEAERSSFCLFLFPFKQGFGTAGAPQLEHSWWQGKPLRLARWAMLILSPPFLRLSSPTSPKARVESSNVPGACFSPPETHPWLVPEVDLGKTRDPAGSSAPWMQSYLRGGQTGTHTAPGPSQFTTEIMPRAPKKNEKPWWVQLPWLKTTWKC